MVFNGEAVSAADRDSRSLADSLKPAEMVLAVALACVPLNVAFGTAL